MQWITLVSLIINVLVIARLLYLYVRPHASLYHYQKYSLDAYKFTDKWEFIVHLPTGVWQKRKVLFVRVKDISREEHIL